MSDSSQAQLGDLPAANSSRSGKLRRVFVGERGLRVGWSVLLFAAIYLILDNVVTGILGHFIALDATSISLTQALLQEGRETLIVLLATWVMARIEKRPLLSYGYTDVHKAIRLVSGAAWGFLCLSVLVGVLWKTGLLVFDGLSLNGMVAWKYALGWALVFLVVGIFEESLFRGYLQYTLAR